MGLALVLTGLVAFWDARREIELATRDLGEQQVSLAREASAELAARAAWRLGLSIAVATGLVLFFGGWAMRVNQRQLILAHRLDLARLERVADERLAHANKAATLGTLAIGIAHEISTPLAIIAIRAEQLGGRGGSRPVGEERVREGAAVILDQAGKIGETIRQMTSLVRGELSTTGNASPREVITGAVALVAHRFAHRGVALEVEEPESRSLVCGDVRLLGQALVDVLLRACEVSRPGDTVTISVREREGFVEVAVTEARSETATPDGRGDAAEPDLGLAREILASHRGDLRLEPRALHGTVARLRVPVAAATQGVTKT